MGARCSITGHRFLIYCGKCLKTRKKTVASALLIYGVGSSEIEGPLIRFILVFTAISSMLLVGCIKQTKHSGSQNGEESFTSEEESGANLSASPSPSPGTEASIPPQASPSSAASPVPPPSIPSAATTPTTAPMPAPSTTPMLSTNLCNISSLANSMQDASGAIQNCIDSASNNSIVELPVGRYQVAHKILIDRPMTIRTQNHTESMVPCQPDDTNDCAVLVTSMSLPMIEWTFQITGLNIHVDHLEFDGNREARIAAQNIQQCPESYVGGVLLFNNPDSSFTNNVLTKTTCRTAMYVTGALRTRVAKNIVLGNGDHSKLAMWSDGITFGNGINSAITENQFFDNTDIDLVIGGCHGCQIQNNRIRHSTSFAGSSFVAMHIAAFDNSFPNYYESDISRNDIDCGPSKRCGFGMYVGVNAWHAPGELDNFVGHSPMEGGSIHDNTIKNSQQGFSVDQTTGPIEIYNNISTDNGGYFLTTCGYRTTGDYTLSRRAIVDRSRDQVPMPWYYSTVWDGCIPNALDISNTPLPAATSGPVSVCIYLSNNPVTGVLVNDTFTTGTDGCVSSDAIFGIYDLKFFYPGYPLTFEVINHASRADRFEFRY